VDKAVNYPSFNIEFRDEFIEKPPIMVLISAPSGPRDQIGKLD